VERKQGLGIKFGACDSVVMPETNAVNGYKYVVVAGAPYSHGPPRAVFDERFEAERYADGLEDTAWTDIERVPYNPGEGHQE